MLLGVADQDSRTVLAQRQRRIDKTTTVIPIDIPPVATRRQDRTGWTTDPT
jgi:hypothetical protein